MREVNIFKGNDNQGNIEQLEFIINDLKERKILEEV